MDYRPQKGFQETALSNSADILVMGGTAGCGKTITLLMEACRNVMVPRFGGVIFRRTTPQITAPGGLWDTSQQLYPALQARAIESRNKWVFPKGSSLEFRHLEFDKTVLDWQGSQIAFIGFDELTHFSLYQFQYLLSRNRSDCGVRPYIRATCNPDPDSWVKGFISWWLHPVTGMPIKERAGLIRYMTVDNDVFVWGDTPEEVIAQCPHKFQNEALIATGVDISDLIKSVSFVPGSIMEDNLLFVAQDPGYLGNLLSLGETEQMQLLKGSWAVRVDGLGLFDPARVMLLATNHPAASARPMRCITVDAARFGRDFAVIMVWRDWEVVYMSVFKKCDASDQVKEIERLRQKFNVSKLDVVVDQDGVGGGVVKIGGYRGFHALDQAMKDPDERKKEAYKNLKTQCYYRFANRVNEGGVKVNLTSENVMIYEDTKISGRLEVKISVGSSVVDVRELIKQDLNAVKMAKRDMEMKMQINGKDEQKLILGRSPDFGDTFMMREYLDLLPRPGVMKQQN